MIEWKKDSEGEKFDDEHYSNLNKEKTNMLGEKSKIPFIIIGAGILILIVIFFVLNSKPANNQSQNVNLINNRLDKIEARLDSIEALRDQMKNIEDQVRVNSETKAFQQDLSNTVKTNSEAIAEIQKKLSSINSEIKKSSKMERLAPARKAVTSQKIHIADHSEGNKLYHTVRKGDTLYRISQKYGISVQKLQELNGMGSKALIHPGQKLIVGPVNKQ